PAKSIPRRSGASTQLLEVLRLEREGVVRTAAGSVESKVLLDQARTEGDTRYRSGVIQSVIGKSGEHAEPRDHVRNGAQVVISRGCRITADATQDCELGAAARARGLDGFPDLLLVRHARGDDQRLAGRRDVAD